MLTIGVLADTHGLLRPIAVDALRGVDHILHAGDIGKPEVLQGLIEIAPVTAVRGNVDRSPWAEHLPPAQQVQLGGIWFYLLHEISRLNLIDRPAGQVVVVYGHSHTPLVEQRAGILYINPGSAGPRRFKLPVSLAKLYISGDHVRPEVIPLE